MAPDLDVSARRVILNPSQIGVVHPTAVPLGTTNEAPARNTVFRRMVFSMSRFLCIFALWRRKLIAFFVSNCRASFGLVKVNEAGMLSLGLFPPDRPGIAARVHNAYCRGTSPVKPRTCIPLPLRFGAERRRGCLGSDFDLVCNSCHLWE